MMMLMMMMVMVMVMMMANQYDGLQFKMIVCPPPGENYDGCGDDDDGDDDGGGDDDHDHHDDHDGGDHHINHIHLKLNQPYSKDTVITALMKPEINDNYKVISITVVIT